MQGIHLRKYGVEAVIPFVLYEIDGVNLKVDAADGGTDCTITKDEGAEATCTNDFVDEGTGYSITLTATEMEAARITVYVVDAATKVYLDDAIIIETYGHASAQHAFDLDTALASQTVGTCTTNTDMRGTDNAATEAKQDIIDGIVDDIILDTGTTLDTLIKDIPTVAEFEARTLVSADYVVVGDTIAGVTSCGTVTGNVNGSVGSVAAGGIVNASFNADVGSTAYATNIIALAVRKVLDELNLDHLMKVAVANNADMTAEVVDGTVVSNMISATSDTSTYVEATDALEALASAGSGNITQIMGTALAETTAGNLANNFNTLFDNADALTAKVLDDIGAPASGGGSPLVLGAGDVGDFEENGKVHFFWNTIDRSGAAVAPGAATLRVYKDDGTGEVGAPTGITDDRAFDGVVGLHHCKIDLDTTLNNFYEKGKNYFVVLPACTIDTKVVNAVIASFSIENRWANVHFHYGGK